MCKLGLQQTPNTCGPGCSSSGLGALTVLLPMRSATTQPMCMLARSALFLPCQSLVCVSQMQHCGTGRPHIGTAMMYYIIQCQTVTGIDSYHTNATMLHATSDSSVYKWAARDSREAQVETWAIRVDYSAADRASSMLQPAPEPTHTYMHWANRSHCVWAQCRQLPMTPPPAPMIHKHSVQCREYRPAVKVST